MVSIRFRMDDTEEPLLSYKKGYDSLVITGKQILGGKRLKWKDK